MTQLEKLKKAIDNFAKVQRKHASLGAEDTEPDGTFQVQLVRAAKGKEVKVPTTAHGWELYSDRPGSGRAARSLATACQRCVDVIHACPLGESGAVIGYLRDYCWRVEW